MQRTSLISFKKEDIPNILQDLDLKTKSVKNKEFILTKEGEIATCEICESEINTDNLGNIAHNSEHLFCDNPLCFLTYLEKIRK